MHLNCTAIPNGKIKSMYVEDLWWHNVLPVNDYACF